MPEAARRGSRYSSSACTLLSSAGCRDGDMQRDMSPWDVMQETAALAQGEQLSQSQEQVPLLQMP